jgi:hypothetical protein
MRIGERRLHQREYFIVWLRTIVTDVSGLEQLMLLFALMCLTFPRKVTILGRKDETGCPPSVDSVTGGR